MSTPDLPTQPNVSKEQSQSEPVVIRSDGADLHFHQELKADNYSDASGNSQAIEVNIFNQTYSVSRNQLLAAVGVPFAVLLLAIVGSALWISNIGAIRQPEKMTAILRIAVAGFTAPGAENEKGLGNTAGQELTTNIDRILTAANFDFSHEVWGPDRVGTIRGETSEERALSAQQIAEKHDAAIVLYGVIDVSQSTWLVTPEFYITGLSFIDALEITGQHELGSSFSVPGYSDDASRIALSSQLISRAKPFSQLAIGVAFYATRDFDRAYRELIAIENGAMWPDNIGGKQLLYLLLGNVAGRIGQLDLAETWYQQSLLEHPGYARAHAGLGNVYFEQALGAMGDAEDFNSLDLDLIQKSIGAYQQARDAEFQPDRSDIPVKVHFGLGQAYLMQSYADETVIVAPAITEFEAVVTAYEDGENPRLRELAAESLIRLGIIYYAGGDKEHGITLYENGVNLTKQLDNNERSHFLEEQLHTMKTER